MKPTTLIGILIVLFAAALFCFSMWLGGWVMLVGGIVDIVNQCKAEVTDSFVIAKGIAKLILFEIPLVGGGWFSAILACFGLKVMVDG